MRKSKFNLTHMHSTTLDAGYLVPFFLQSTLPGDTFRIGLSSFIRCQPMVAPLMHEVSLYTQYWYVPYRIIWEDWEEFITGGENLDSSPSVPKIISTAENSKIGTLWDYFGFPSSEEGVAGLKVNAFPFRAMAEIWNTRYRDEDLQSEVPISYSSGIDNVTSTDLLSPSWKRDYFTLARPFTQRGSDILVPVSAGDVSSSVIHRHVFKVRVILFGAYQNKKNENLKNASLSYDGKEYLYSDDPDLFVSMINLAFGGDDVEDLTTPLTFDLASIVNSLPISSSTTTYYQSVPSLVFSKTGSSPVKTFTLTNYPVVIEYLLENDSTVPALGIDSVVVFPTNGSLSLQSSKYTTYARYTSDSVLVDSNGWNTFTLYKTLVSAGNISVRDIRASSALQRYAERSLKYGNRYEEFIQREFGVRPRDSRIQRPEYLGGGKGVLSISEVLQTAESTDSGVGTMRGHGISSIYQRPIRFKSPEHGLIIGLLSIRPKAVYMQGFEREWLKSSRLDFFTPELADIGMQEVLQQELYATSTNEDTVFGYNDRYQEYRFHKPLVTGEFRGVLNYWNMARRFDNPPNLNDEFINMAHSAEVFRRPFAVQDQSYHSFLCMLKNNIKAYRPIPKKAKDILK